jgi:hypothetical protein
VENRREHYRIEYPPAEQPTLLLDVGGCPVRDCSERGVRFEAPRADALACGSRVRGVLRFRWGDEAEVDGVVVRVDAGGVALRLQEPGIPFALILQEQRRLYALQAT